VHIDQIDTARAIGRRVREAREEAGLRQDELAFAAGVSTRLVHEIESGKPTMRLDGLLKVLQALGLTIEVVKRPLRRDVRMSDLGSDRADGE
jgi:HTH-type transcriptional regulator / antitoxin HipB